MDYYLFVFQDDSRQDRDPILVFLPEERYDDNFRKCLEALPVSRNFTDDEFVIGQIALAMIIILTGTHFCYDVRFPKIQFTNLESREKIQKHLPQILKFEEVEDEDSDRFWIFQLDLVDQIPMISPTQTPYFRLVDCGPFNIKKIQFVPMNSFTSLELGPIAKMIES